MVGDSKLTGTNFGKRWDFMGHDTKLCSEQGYSWLQGQLDPGTNLQDALTLSPVTFFSALELPILPLQTHFSLQL